MSWHPTGRQWTVHDPEFVGDRHDPDRASALWAGHRWFGYDLVRWGRPDLIVELGTQYGVSLFTFAQAARDEGCHPSLHAVDTWEGDSFTGAYGDDVYETVTRIRDAEFADLDIELHQSLFRDVVGGFADNSIDLLHIDGCHDYDAVKDDFETWLPKVAPGGVVLLHDIAANTDMGSALFWKELVKEHRAFDFQHSLGLGVLFPKGVEGFDYLFGDEFERWRGYYAGRWGEHIGQLQFRDQSEMIRVRDQIIAERVADVLERDEVIGELNDLLTERDRQAAETAGIMRNPIVRAVSGTRRLIRRAIPRRGEAL